MITVTCRGPGYYIQDGDQSVQATGDKQLLNKLSAAPDLLEALVEFVYRAEELNYAEHVGARLIAKARAAIAKATGKT